MSFVIRCIASSDGVKTRLTLPTKNATFGELQSEIQSKYGVSPDVQVINRTDFRCKPLSPPQFIENASPSTKLTALGINHGDAIYLVLADNQVQTYNEKQKQESQSTANSLADSKAEPDTEQKYQSTDSKAKTYALKPLAQRKKKGPLKMNLDELKQDPVVDAGPKHVPFHEFIQERQRKLAKTQPWNIDPPKFDYKPVPMGNHVNFSELPPNAIVMRQKYRHVDVATFYDSSPYLKFKSEWEKSNAIQRCAYLIGRYEMIDNNLTKKKKVSTSTQVSKKESKLMCAKIYALYEPPQKGTGRGVKLLKDHNEELVDAVIKACDMQRIGIVFTTLPRGGKKYKGDIFMSGQEIFTSARLQEKYKNPNTGYSKFVTLICHVGMKEAQCFMISDQGVAMIKNGLIAAGTTSLTNDDEDNYGFMRVNEPPPKIYLPAVINENKEIKQGDHFAPDALLVNIIATVAKNQQHIFNFVHFPAPRNASIDFLRKHLIHHKDKELHVALSDFNLLIYLTKVIDASLVIQIAQHVVQKERMSEELVKKIKAQLRLKVPGY